MSIPPPDRGLLSKAQARQDLERGLEQRRGALLNPLDGYLRDSAASSLAVWLALAVLVACEMAHGFSGGALPRPGLERWFAWGLERLLGPTPFSLGLVSAAVLLVWHRRSGESVGVSARGWAGLLAEAALIGMVLTMLTRAARLVWVWPEASGWHINGPGDAAEPHGLALAAAFAAAAVQEEVVFRLLMLGGAVWLAGRCGLRGWSTRSVLVVASALLFAAAHYSLLNPAGQPFQAADFVCHFLLAVLLGLISLTRGLALAIGVHCAYNLMALV